MTSAELLLVTVALIGFIWTLIQFQIAKKEFLYFSEQRKWVRKSVIYFLILVLGEYALGYFDVLSDFSKMPPPFVFFLGFIFVLPFFIAFSKFGDLMVKNLTLPLVIAFQSFRILAEGVIYLGVHEGIAPVQLSFEGYQFDIITGVTALIVAVILAYKKSRWLGWLWNWMGVGFLLVIAFIAAASMPTPYRVFMQEPSNVWVTHAPYILLPGVLVVAALTAHLIAFRMLKSAGSGDDLRYRDF